MSFFSSSNYNKTKLEVGSIKVRGLGSINENELLHFFFNKDAKKSRNRLTLGEKLEIINLFDEKGWSKAKISREKGMPEPSVRKILKDKEDLKLQGAQTAEYGALCSTKTRPRQMLEMERLLMVWIDDCNHRRVMTSLKETLFKAKSLYEFATAKLEEAGDMTEAEKNDTFDASTGWWHRFTKRMNVASENLLGEAGSADIKAAEEFPAKLKKIIEGKSLSKMCLPISEFR